MIGTPFPDDDSPKLRAARQDASIMADQIQAAYIEVMRSAANVQPVMLVLEDLHWGDAPSVKLVDAALRELKNRPFVVVAFARPEVHDRIPKLWTERDVQEIRLREMSRRAAESMVKSALGAQVEDKTVAMVVDRAEGNAFYLEELIRAVAEGHEEALPETVLGMVEARLAELDTEVRRLLRAASILGETFWRGAVFALLGEPLESGRKDRLAALVEQEVLVRHIESRLAGEEEYAFRHALLREGAYAMLTERDRTLGHKLAGEWLEQAGEKDPKLLAEHFDRGGEGARAAAHYLRAAEQAREGGDYEATIKLAERGFALGGEPDLLAALRAVEAEARYRSGDFEGALRAGREGVSLSRPGSRSHCGALFSVAGVLLARGKVDALQEVTEQLLRTEPEPDAIAPLVAAMSVVMPSLLFMLQRDAAELYLRRMEQLSEAVAEQDAIAIAWIESMRVQWLGFVERDNWGAHEKALATVFQSERAGAGGIFSFARVLSGATDMMLGRFDLAEEGLKRILATTPAGSPDAMHSQFCLAFISLEQGRIDEASAIAAALVQEAEARGEMFMRFHARLLLIEIHLHRGEIEAAEAEALALGDALAMLPMLALWHPIVLARTRLAQGRAREAAEVAAHAYSRTQIQGIGLSYRHAALLLVRAEAFHAAGDQAAACQAIRDAQEDLLRIAGKIPDPEVRRGFLENLGDHRRTLQLAKEWLGQGSDSPVS
jgi:eukaryotic-like serine/threonine-protein kinase